MKSRYFLLFYFFAVLVGNAQEIQRHHQTLDKKGNLSLLLTNRLTTNNGWGWNI
jgi:hypothetical protein